MNTVALNNAILVASSAHSGQYRQGGEDYIHHPMRVSNTLRIMECSDDLILAGLLHDVLEDSDTSYTELIHVFNTNVASLVLEVTNDPVLVKEFGKTAYLSAKLATLSNDALILKLADRLDNISDLINASDDFKKSYINETLILLGTLKDYKGFNDKHYKLYHDILLKIGDYEMEESELYKLRKENPDVY